MFEEFWEFAKDIHAYFVELEKTYDQVSREELGQCCGSTVLTPPVTGHQVIVFLLRSLYPCRGGLITTFHRGCWTLARLFSATTPLHNLCEFDRMSQSNKYMWGG